FRELVSQTSIHDLFLFFFFFRYVRLLRVREAPQRQGRPARPHYRTDLAGGVSRPQRNPKLVGGSSI
ncbi:MAG: hypothetical protein N2512_01890, partial [Armatimonadetes bacterium]|nr:hypothetical protein [Armatimonadota bacterium]